MIGKYLMIVFTQLRGFEEYISWIVLRLTITIDINHNVFLVCVKSMKIEKNLRLVERSEIVSKYVSQVS